MFSLQLSNAECIRIEKVRKREREEARQSRRKK